jgi:hypothetical protein
MTPAVHSGFQRGQKMYLILFERLIRESRTASIAQSLTSDQVQLKAIRA